MNCPTKNSKDKERQQSLKTVHHRFNSRMFNQLWVGLTEQQACDLQKILPSGYFLVYDEKRTDLKMKPPINQKNYLIKCKSNNANETDHENRRETKKKPKSTASIGELRSRIHKIFWILRDTISHNLFQIKIGSLISKTQDILEENSQKINFSLIEKKIKNGSYFCFKEFEDDLKQAWEEADEIFPYQADLYTMADEERKVACGIIEIDDSSDDQKRPYVAATPKKKMRAPKIQKPKIKIVQQSLNTPTKRIAKKSLIKATKSPIRPLSFNEKKRLSYQIRQLPTDNLWDVWKIVNPDDDGCNNQSFEFDITKLDPKTGRELEKYVQVKYEKIQIQKKTKKRQRRTNFKTPTVASNNDLLLSKHKFEEDKLSELKDDKFFESEESFKAMEIEKELMGPALPEVNPTQTDSSFISDLDESI
jgi:hypothetical protein